MVGGSRFRGNLPVHTTRFVIPAKAGTSQFFNNNPILDLIVIPDSTQLSSKT